MERAAADALLASTHHGVLITIRADGRPQSSNIAYTYADGVARISVTDGRAKTANLRRDPRAVLHVSSPDFWRYVSASGTVEPSPVSTTPGDDVGRELLEVYDAISPEPHPDPEEFLQAMVDDRRLVLRLTVDHVAGQG